jgi:hypothetical protein
VSEKVEGKIDFPMSINMLPYTTKSSKKETIDKSRYWYDLASAVIHKGKLDAGHYYVYCRQGDQVSEPRACTLVDLISMCEAFLCLRDLLTASDNDLVDVIQ